MTLQQLQALMAAGDMTRCMHTLETHCIIKNVYDCLKQYDPYRHQVFDESIRKNKIINDGEGGLSDIVKVARLPLSLQKKIVLIAAAFLGCPEIDVTTEGQLQEDFVTILKKIWDDNKLNYKFKAIAKKTMSERHCAELWYVNDAEADYWLDYLMDSKFKVGVKLIAGSLGDSLWPVFDDFGNMIAFGRGYKVMNEKAELIQHFDVYTSDEIFKSKQEGNAWLFSNGVDYTGQFTSLPNELKKIPVIYYCKPITEWHDVQPLIEALETITSDHNDTNKYFGSPIVVASGKVEGFAQKGETGKLLTAENGAKVEYLTWNFLPESVKLEMDNLNRYIHTLTHTPDISFENLKGLGYFSTVALQTMFLDAHLKASDNEEIFGEGVQRRINFLKHTIAILDPIYKPVLKLTIKPKFEYYLPKNTVELIETLTKAVQGKILSKETAVEQNPFVVDPKAEMGRIEGEAVVIVPPIPVPGNGVPVPLKQ